MTPTEAETVAVLVRGIERGRGAYLNAEQVRALAGLIRGMLERENPRPTE
mgnify:CR=1 FL=1